MNESQELPIQELSKIRARSIRNNICIAATLITTHTSVLRLLSGTKQDYPGCQSFNTLKRCLVHMQPNLSAETISLNGKVPYTSMGVQMETGKAHADEHGGSRQ